MYAAISIYILLQKSHLTSAILGTNTMLFLIIPRCSHSCAKFIRAVIHALRGSSFCIHSCAKFTHVLLSFMRCALRYIAYDMMLELHTEHYAVFWTSLSNMELLQHTYRCIHLTLLCVCTLSPTTPLVPSVSLFICQPHSLAHSWPPLLFIEYGLDVGFVLKNVFGWLISNLTYRSLPRT